MARFNLNKGDRFALDKAAGLNQIQVDLTWKSGADLDASAFLVGEEGYILEDADFVFYNSKHRCDPETHEDKPYSLKIYGPRSKWQDATIPYSSDGSVLGSADDLGDGDEEEGEDASETMHVILDKVKPEVREIIFCITIYHGDEEGTTFGSVREPAVTITNEETGEELCSYKLNEKFTSETAVEAAKLVLNDEGEWEFEAVGQGYEGGMQTLIDLYA